MTGGKIVSRVFARHSGDRRNLTHSFTRSRSAPHAAHTMASTRAFTRREALACDRAALRTGIVHFGVGGFHRSHQQVRVAL